MEPITAYSAYWHPQSDSGRLYLRLHNGQTVNIPVNTPQELAAMLDMLRHNRNAVWDSENAMVGIAWQAPGVSA
jgi:acyl CoA:acetate/3-ketoacid CoA transferase beta subunit